MTTLVLHRPVRGRLLLLGPAFVAAIAYVDPGNVAANLSAGAEYGYLLVWVVRTCHPESLDYLRGEVHQESTGSAQVSVAIAAR